MSDQPPRSPSPADRPPPEPVRGPYPDDPATGRVAYRPTPGKASPVFTAEQARGGRIILNTPTKRWVFIAGLAGIVLLPLLLLIFRG